MGLVTQEITVFTDLSALKNHGGEYLIISSAESGNIGRIMELSQRYGGVTSFTTEKPTLEERFDVKLIIVDDDELILKSITFTLAKEKDIEIASQLFLSEGTVRNNIVVIMEKLEVSNRTQLGMAYYEGNSGI